MDELREMLREHSVKPRSTAVKHVQKNEAALCKKYNVRRGFLRQIAVLIDRQTKEGYLVKDTQMKIEKRKIAAAAPKREKKVIPIKKESPKEEEAPVSKKKVAPVKKAAKKAPRRKSKKKS